MGGFYAAEKIKEKPLKTSELGPCFVLCARGYDIHENLSQLGMAHWFHEEDTPETFFKMMRERVGQGKIELFIAGGKNDQNGRERLEEITSSAAMYQITVTDSVARRFFNRFLITSPWEEEIYAYNGSTGIQHAWFDVEGNPHLHISCETMGKDVPQLLQEAEEHDMRYEASIS